MTGSKGPDPTRGRRRSNRCLPIASRQHARGRDRGSPNVTDSVGVEIHEHMADSRTARVRVPGHAQSIRSPIPEHRPLEKLRGAGALTRRRDHRCDGAQAEKYEVTVTV